MDIRISRHSGQAVEHQMTHPTAVLLGPKLKSYMKILGTGLADVDAEPTEARRESAERTIWGVLKAQSANQIVDLLGHDRSDRIAAANLPGREQSEAFPVPDDHCFRLDDDKCRSPVAP